MKKSVLVLCLALVSTLSFGQITFEKGYFIKEDDSKEECLIKNMDWKNNPTTFKYMLSEAEEVVDNDISRVKEFGIYGSSKFVRKTVLVDIANENINDLSTVRQAENEEKQVFLKVLVEGSASLYLFADNKSKKYFYSIENENPTQLLYKRYLVSGNGIKENNYYKQQLINTLVCEGINSSRLEELNYDEKDLVSLFIDYNNCGNATFVNHLKTKGNGDLFNFSLKTGVSNTSFSFIEGGFPINNYNFEKKITYRIGVEAELLFPFNKQKWALITDPTYQRYASEIEVDNSSSVKIDFKSIEIPVGLRHYMFLNKNSKLFINASFIFYTVLSSDIIFSTGRTYELTSGNSFAAGFGYKFANKYSVEFRVQTPSNPLKNYNSLDSNYSSTSVIVGYTLF